MDKYQQAMRELSHLFPHHSGIEVIVTTSQADFNQFDKDLHEYMKTQFVIPATIEGKDIPQEEQKFTRIMFPPNLTLKLQKDGSR